MAWQAERDDRERRSQGRAALEQEARAFAGRDDEDWLQLRRATTGWGRRVRIDEAQVHRAEEEYRHPGRFRRAGRRYEAGAYADRSGQGYEDTSGAGREWEGFRSCRGRRGTGGGGRMVRREDEVDADDDLDGLTAEEVVGRLARLRETLARLR